MRLGNTKGRCENALLDVMKVPPVGDVPYACEDVHEFAAANKCHPEERRASHDLGVVEIALEWRQVVRRNGKEDVLPVYARIVE